MNQRQKVISLFLVICLFLVALKLSIDFPTGLGIYYGNTSATNPEGTIRFTTAEAIQVALLSPPDNTIFTIAGATTTVSFTCRVSNLTPANVTQVRLYTDIFGPFNITQTTNVSGAPPHTVTFNVSGVPLGTHQWNCQGVTSTGITRFAPANFRFTVRQAAPAPTPGGGGRGGRYVEEEVLVVEEAAYPLECVLPPAGLVSWWTFDYTYEDFWNPYREGIEGGEPRFIDEKINGSILLDGSEDFVRVLPENTYDLLEEGTIDGWIHYKKKSDYAVIFSYGDGVSGHFELRINPAGTLELAVENDGSFLLVKPDNQFNFKKHSRDWVHFALAYEDMQYTWFINGVQYDSVVVVSDGSPGFWIADLSGRPLSAVIGAAWRDNAPMGHFKGSIDELEIYDRALYLLEVNAVYARSKCKIRMPEPPAVEEPAVPVPPPEPDVKKTRLFGPDIRAELPLWLLIIALLAIAAVMFTYYKGIKQKVVKGRRKKSRKKKK